MAGHGGRLSDPTDPLTHARRERTRAYTALRKIENMRDNARLRIARAEAEVERILGERGVPAESRDRESVAS